MKRFKLLSAFFVLFTAISLTGCSDEDPSMLDIGDGGSGDGTMNVSINFKINDEVMVFNATSASASVTNSTITIDALNEDTDETLTISWTGNQLTTYTANSIVYNDGNGNEYEAVNPLNDEPSGMVKLDGVNTAGSTISGYFSFIGSTGSGSEAVAFYSGSFNNVVYTGSLPTPTTPTPGTGQYIKAKVDGEQINWDNVTVDTLEDQTIVNGLNMTNMSIVQIVFPDTSVIVADAVLPISQGAGAIGVQISVGMTAYAAQEGSITIISVTNGLVKASFQFTAQNTDGTQTVEVTEGEFTAQI